MICDKAINFTDNNRVGVELQLRWLPEANKAPFYISISVVAKPVQAGHNMLFLLRHGMFLN